MKLSFPYNLKKTAVFLLATSLPLVFGGCEKDPFSTKPDNPQNTYNIEYIYNETFKFHRVGDTTLILSSAFIDTVAKHGADARVKQIHIKPDYENMWSTDQEAQMESRAKKLRNMYISSNNKLSGENTTLVLDAASFNNSNVQNVLHDTLRINLVQR